MMKTGFKSLDEIINLAEPQLILLTGTNNIEELSGDIANNVCLKQECDVLEIVNCKLGYILQRMFVNLADVNYRSWYRRNEYTDEELKRIAIKIEDVIEGTKKFPKIIEQGLFVYDLKKVAKFVEDYANHYADRGTPANTLVVLDIFPLKDIQKHLIYSKTRRLRKYLEYRKDRNDCLKLIKELRKISHELSCPIIFIDNIDMMKKYNADLTRNYLTKNDIDNIKQVNKYVDKFIILNADKREDINLYNVDVYNQKEKIGICKLKFDSNCRKFLDYEE